eukprot:5918874-Pyramimonas_sp.AAC.1
MDAFDQLPRHKHLEFDAYIDDTGVSSTGSHKQVVQQIVSTSIMLHHVITNDMGRQLSLDK